MNGEIKPTSDVVQTHYGTRDQGVRTTREEDSSAAPARSSAGPDSVDNQRVEEIRRAIADGSYRIDADLVAERMLATEALQKKSER